MAQSVSKLFTIDTEHKTFVFNHNNYQDLFVDGSEVNPLSRPLWLWAVMTALFPWNTSA